MQVSYKNNSLERTIIAIKVLASMVVSASFVIMFGFDRPLLPIAILYNVQIAMLFVFLAGKIVRLLNVYSIKDYLRANWFEIPLLLALVAVLIGSNQWFETFEPQTVRHFAIGFYLLIEIIIKICRTVVNLAASGRNPTKMLISSFFVLIISGAGLLMLPKANTQLQRISFVDALFTTASATCVTGLTVKDIGKDFSFAGQVIILTLIQLGGLGIVLFGAVFSLLLGQALSIRGSVAMQDLLSAGTLNKIGKMIMFIFFSTVIIEAIGAVSMYGTWSNEAGKDFSLYHQWFCSIFHSISAFCNAGFSLFSDNLIKYNRSWQVYVVICPLIILGGLGFSVLYDLSSASADRVKRFFKKLSNKRYRFSMETPKRIQLQSKIVLSISAALIIFGTVTIMIFERYAGGHNPAGKFDILGALFQSVTARTAGFNTIDIASMSASSRFILILLMFVGGSPGSTAGGIKTVTLAVVLMSSLAALRKRQEVEMFKRSVSIAVVGKAITVTLLFLVVLFTATLVLSVTENSNGFTMSEIMFEAGSALGTVGLSTGITSSLTTAGKLIIITVMLIGKLGPLTLLAALTFNLKPAKYSYPQEALIVG